jgi:AraC family transcriptional regulator
MAGNSSILRFERFAVEQSVYPADTYMPPHTDKFSRTSIILDGQLQEKAGSEAFNAKPGSLVIKPNDVVHENIFGKKPVRSLSISFYDDLLMKNYFQKWQWIDHPGVSVMGVRLWTQMRKARTETDVMKSCHDFFSELTLLKYNAADKPVFWQQQLKALIEKDLSTPENIQLLSQKLSLHRVYLARAFKKKYGVSPVEFRTYTRIAAAILDLSLTDKTLVSIAFDAGFADQSHLNREFKKKIGCTPLSFRQKMQNDKVSFVQDWHV